MMTQTPSFWFWAFSIALHGLVLIIVFYEPSPTMEQARDGDSVEVKVLPANVIVEAQSLPQAGHSLPVEAAAPRQKTAFASEADAAEAAPRKAVSRQYASNSTRPIAEPLQNDGKAELALSSKAPKEFDFPGIIDTDGDHAPAMQVPELAQWTVTRRLIQTGDITVHINLKSHGSVVWFRNSLLEARETASEGVQASQRGWEVKKTNDLSQVRRRIINEIAPQAERRYIDRRYLENAQIQLRLSVAFDNILLGKQARFAQSQGCKLQELRSTRFKKAELSGRIDFRIVGAEKIDTAGNNCLQAVSYGE